MFKITKVIMIPWIEREDDIRFIAAVLEEALQRKCLVKVTIEIEEKEKK